MISIRSAIIRQETAKAYHATVWYRYTTKDGKEGREIETVWIPKSQCEVNTVNGCIGKVSQFILEKKEEEIGAKYGYRTVGIETFDE